MNFHVWLNNYGILAAKVTTPQSGTITAGAANNQTQCTAKAVACSQRLTENFSNKINQTSNKNISR